MCGFAPYDAVAMPTCAIVPPPIADLADDHAFTKANLLSLRNCTLINMMDGCAISAPLPSQWRSAGRLHAERRAGGSDRRILEFAAGVEAAIHV